MRITWPHTAGVGGGRRAAVTGETVVLPASTVKNYRSVSLLAFGQRLLVNRKSKARVAKDVGDQHPNSQRLGGQKKGCLGAW